MPPGPRNVIWITTDHMRFENIAAHGNPTMVTPNLDRLVRGGVSFANAFVQNPVCMASRCSFMTGLYPQQTGVTWNGHCLPQDFYPTVARVFGEAGYQTTQIGKLHFQPHEDNDLDPRPRHDYGFDVFYLAEEPGCYEDAYMTWLRLAYSEHVDQFRIPRSSSPSRPRNDPSQHFAYVIDAPWEASFSGWIATVADDYLSQRHRRHAKQFMHLGFYAPHPPLNPTMEMFAPYVDVELPPPCYGEEEWLGVDAPFDRMLQMCHQWTDEQLLKYKRHFYAMVTGVDMAVGKVLARLEQNGELEDSLIVFCSDHGDMLGDHRMLGKGYQMYYDQVMRVPCVLYWPNGFGLRGVEVHGLIEMVDILPTLLELCGAHVPDMMVGHSYATDLMEGRIPEGRKEVIAYSIADSGMLRTADFKYCRFPVHGTEVLFDLRSDPQERRDVARNHRETRDSMRDRMLDRFLNASRSSRAHYHLF